MQIHRYGTVLSMWLVLVGITLAEDKPLDILQKAVEAHGGKENLEKHTNAKVTSKGTIQLMGNEIAFSNIVEYALPGKERSEIKMEVAGQEVSMTQIINGDRVSLNFNGMSLPLSKGLEAELKQAVLLREIYHIVPLLDKKYELKIVDKSAKVRDQEAVVIWAKSKELNEVRLFFDKKTFLLMKLERVGINEMEKQVEMEFFFSDYKDVDKVKRAMKIELYQDGKEFMKTNISEFKHESEIDKKRFLIKED